MVHPLVIDTKRAFNGSQMGNGILSQYGDTVGIDQIRDAVMDFRINVVWPSCQHNAVSSCLIQVAQGFLALSADILPASGHFLPGSVGGVRDFRGGDVLEFFQQSLCDGLLIRHG